MYGLLIAVMLVSWAVFVGSVLLMSPKGGLGAMMGGIGQGAEYGSKKTLEGKIKKVALAMAIIFVLSVLCIPYVLPNATSA